MKQQTITINNRTILVLDLPKDATNVQLENSNDLNNPDDDFFLVPNLQYNTQKKLERCVLLPAENWQLLGFISEEVAVKVVELKLECCGNPDEGTQQCCHKPISLPFTHLDILKQELQSNGILTVNPYRGKPMCNALCGTEFSSCDGKECQLLLWQTAQSQLWENIIILVKDE